MRTTLPIPKILPDCDATSWTMVAQVRSQNEKEALEARNRLCRAYWYPIYLLIRAHAYAHSDAQDLTQGFFEVFLHRDGFAKADREKGRLRNYLLTSVNHYLISAHEHSTAQKRGSGKVVLAPFDSVLAENQYRVEPVDHLSPDRLFQRRWALQLLEGTFELLRSKYAADGLDVEYDALRPMLGFSGEALEEDYAAISARTGVETGALRARVCRLRAKFVELLRKTVAATLWDTSDESINEELRELREWV